MTQLFATRLGAVKPSASIAAKGKVDRLRAEGRKVIDFTIGEPDFSTPSHIVTAGINALVAGHTRYTGSAGIPQLRKAIAAKLARENQLSYTPEEIVVGCGAKQIIYSALEATLNDGDEVIIPAPYWVSYPDMVSIHGGVPVIVACGPNSGFKLTPQQLEQAITPRTKWLILNTPNNPTGAVYSAEELRGIAAVLRKYPHVWLMTDEIYEHFTYGGVKHVPLLQQNPDIKSRALVVNGMSKVYAMTGWRVGYGAGPVSLIKAITLLLTQSTTCTSSVSQVAAVEALEGPQDCVSHSVHLFEQRCHRIVQLLSNIPGLRCAKPDGAFYVFPSVEGLLGAVTPEGQVLKSDPDVVLYLLEKANVATIDGSSYGMPGFLRISFATSIDQIEIGCAAISQAIAACTFPTHPVKESSHA